MSFMQIGRQNDPAEPRRPRFEGQWPASKRPRGHRRQQQLLSTPRWNKSTRWPHRRQITTTVICSMMTMRRLINYDEPQLITSICHSRTGRIAINIRLKLTTLVRIIIILIVIIFINNIFCALCFRPSDYLILAFLINKFFYLILFDNFLVVFGIYYLPIVYRVFFCFYYFGVFMKFLFYYYYYIIIQ